MQEGENLSNSEVQMVGIVKMMLSRKQIIILDEFASNINPKGVGVILGLLPRYLINKTVIIITHQSQQIEICNWVVKVENHKV